MTKLRKVLKIACIGTVTGFLGVFLFSPADAQRGPEGRGGGPRDFDPEQMERTWLLQADSVSSTLGLDEAATDKVGELYLTARQNLQEKMMKARESGEGWESVRESRTEAVTEFKASLTTLLEAERAEKAMELLGGFSFRADMGANRLSEIIEDKEKLRSAVGILMKSMGGPRGNPEGRRNRSAGEGRGDRGAQFDELFEQLKTVMTEEQITEFRDSLDTFGRRGPGGPGRGARQN